MSINIETWGYEVEAYYVFLTDEQLQLAASNKAAVALDEDGEAYPGLLPSLIYGETKGIEAFHDGNYIICGLVYDDSLILKISDDQSSKEYRITDAVRIHQKINVYDDIKKEFNELEDSIKSKIYVVAIYRAYAIFLFDGNFDCLENIDNLDIKKLVFHTFEYSNGEDIVGYCSYGDEECFITGEFSHGKGSSTDLEVIKIEDLMK